MDKVTEEKIARGGLLVRFYFDMRHNDREKLQPIMADLINERLMKEKGIVYCYGAIEEPLEKQGVFITSATVTILFDSFIPLTDIAFRYAPAGIEILRPTRELHFKASELQSMLMNLSDISMNYSKYILENVLKPEDLENIRGHLEDRASIGKKIMEERKKKEES